LHDCRRAVYLVATESEASQKQASIALPGAIFYQSSLPRGKGSRKGSLGKEGNGSVTREGARRSLLELLLLSYADANLLTPMSSFSEMAGEHVIMQPCNHATMQPCNHVTMQPCDRVLVQVCKYAVMQPCARTSMQPCTHVLMYSCTHVLMYSCTHVLMYSCTHVLMYSCTHVLMYSCTHVLMYSCTHVLMYSCTHVLTYSRTHVRMYSRNHAIMQQCNHAIMQSCNHAIMQSCNQSSPLSRQLLPSPTRQPLSPSAPPSTFTLTSAASSTTSPQQRSDHPVVSCRSPPRCPAR
jgi:hypothetical protein